MNKNLITKLATLFGLGNFPIAPGTIGSFVGILVYITIIQMLPIAYQIFLIAVSILLGIIICDIAENKIGQKDPNCIILDEFIAIPICFLGVQNYISSKASLFMLFVLGFIIFRSFDILKPLGIRKIQNLSGGIGIVADDILAAIYTNICLIVICLTVL